MPNLLVLFESASGYSLLEAVEGGDLAALKAEVQGAVTDLARFSKIVKLHAFQPFSTAENALANINDISEGIVNDDLRVRGRGTRAISPPAPLPSLHFSHTFTSPADIFAGQRFED